jgi:hypothetical protein
MGIIKKMMKQRCIYWAPKSIDLFGGSSYAEPVELKCRWEDISTEIITAEGASASSRATVYVGVDVLQGGFLMLGSLDDFCTVSSLPNEYPKAFRILSFEKLPNMKATEYLRTVKL